MGLNVLRKLILIPSFALSPWLRTMGGALWNDDYIGWSLEDKIFIHIGTETNYKSGQVKFISLSGCSAANLPCKLCSSSNELLREREREREREICWLKKLLKWLANLSEWKWPSLSIGLWRCVMGWADQAKAYLRPGFLFIGLTQIQFSGLKVRLKV